MIVSPRIEMEQWNQRSVSLPAAVSVRPVALVALFIAGFTTFVDLYVTQPLLPEFRQIFRASELWVSLTITAPILAVALVAPLLGLLADSIGRKRVIVAALFGLVIPTALASTSANLGQFVMWRFFAGLFYSRDYHGGNRLYQRRIAKSVGRFDHGHLRDRDGCRRFCRTVYYRNGRGLLGLACRFSGAGCDHARGSTRNLAAPPAFHQVRAPAGRRTIPQAPAAAPPQYPAPGNVCRWV